MITRERFDRTKRIVGLIGVSLFLAWWTVELAWTEWDAKHRRQNVWGKHRARLAATRDEQYAATVGRSWPIIRAVLDRVPEETGRLAILAPATNDIFQLRLQLAFLGQPRKVLFYDRMIQYYKTRPEELDDRNFVLDMHADRDPHYLDMFTTVAAGKDWRLLRFKERP